MRKSMTVMGLASILAAVVPAPVGFARLDPPATQPTTAPAARDVESIMNDFQAAAGELQQILPAPDALYDPAKRADAAAKALPSLRKMQGYANELSGVPGPAAGLGKQINAQLDTMLAVFDDAEAVARLKTLSTDADPDTAVRARGSLLFSSWIKTNRDAAAQAPLVTEATALAKEHPSNDDVAGLLMQMGEVGAANDQIKQQLRDAATGMTSGLSQQLKAQFESDAKLTALENKPLTIAGVNHKGEQFSTESMKGKVILVDFWATWCGPCIAELPRVKKIYAEYHDKGLEIVGVSCDETADDLNKFLGEHPDMPWVQLFDAANPGWHALATQYGITGIPTMFLIDKQGVLRTVKARENLEEMIPKLLAE